MLHRPDSARALSRVVIIPTCTLSRASAIRRLMRHITQLFAAAAATLLLAFSASAADSPPFPRLAGVNNGAPHNYEDPAYQAKLAKLNWSLLAIWVGWGVTSDTTMEQVVRNIKAINPELQGVPVREPHGSGRGQCGRGGRVREGRQDEVVGLRARQHGPVAALAVRQANIEGPISGQQHLVHSEGQLRLSAMGMARPLGRAAVLQAESVDRWLLRGQRLLAAARRR